MIIPINYENIEQNENGNNKNIKFKCLADDEMIGLGFRRCDNYDSNRFYFCGRLGHDILFNLTVNRDNSGEIDMLDEYFCQPYDWQSMVIKISPNKPNPRNINVLEKIQKKAYEYMQKFTDAGVINGWKEGDYI